MVCKTILRKGFVGSNPTSSTIFYRGYSMFHDEDFNWEELERTETEYKYKVTIKLRCIHCDKDVFDEAYTKGRISLFCSKRCELLNKLAA